MPNAINRSTTPPAQSHVHVRITPTLAADLAAQGLFPALQDTAAAAFREGPSFVYRVSVDYAEGYLTYAQGRRKELGRNVRGLAHALTSLIERLRGDIKDAKGLWDDPGEQAAIGRQEMELARFNVGDRVRRIDGMVMTIVRGYAVYKTSAEDGVYSRADQSPCSYRPGYHAMDSAGRVYFYSPSDIETVDGDLGYLRLAYPRPEAA